MSLWRVLALAWLSAGTPAPAQESLFPDQIVARAAEEGGDRALAAFLSDAAGRPSALERRRGRK